LPDFARIALRSGSIWCSAIRRSAFRNAMPTSRSGVRSGSLALTHPALRHSPRVRVFLDFLAGEIAQERGLIEGERGRSPDS
jgi:hypothetical protein